MDGKSLGNVTLEWLAGIIVGSLVGLILGFVCDVPKAIIAFMSVISFVLGIITISEDMENGDIDLVLCDASNIIFSIAALFMKCFTGDTLVATEDGDKRIDEIAVGDYVWAEDTVTGEQVLKRVNKVYIKETDHLIHIGTSTGEDIETTENHPFYTEERGWVAASELKEGETLHTEDGDIVTVTYVERHHIASDKSKKSGFTAKYQELFDRAGMSLQDPDNIVELEGHKGAYTKKYKQKVLDYLTDVLSGIDKNDKEKNEEALRNALKELRQLLLDNPRLPYKGGWDD